MNQSERRQILLRALLDEKPAWRQAGIPAQAGEQKQILRGLMNVREAAPLDPALLAIQDAYLTAETQAKGITDCRELPQIQPGISLWQGDITTLRCDAIVNAANSGMTGCCISTGEFRFPPERAAEIAVDTVKCWLSRQSGPKQVIFNVFQARDKAIYERLLSWGRPCG